MNTSKLLSYLTFLYLFPVQRYTNLFMGNLKVFYCLDLILVKLFEGLLIEIKTRRIKGIQPYMCSIRTKTGAVPATTDWGRDISGTRPFYDHAICGNTPIFLQ